jgi:hypothetical protein
LGIHLLVDIGTGPKAIRVFGCFLFMGEFALNCGGISFQVAVSLP